MSVWFPGGLMAQPPQPGEVGDDSCPGVSESDVGWAGPGAVLGLKAGSKYTEA